MHEHAWSADPGVVAHYVCACGATGYRRWRTGEIREHKRKPERSRQITARADSVPDVFGHGRVAAKRGAP